MADDRFVRPIPPSNRSPVALKCDRVVFLCAAYLDTADAEKCVPEFAKYAQDILRILEAERVESTTTITVVTQMALSVFFDVLREMTKYALTEGDGDKHEAVLVFILRALQLVAVPTDPTNEDYVLVWRDGRVDEGPCAAYIRAGINRLLNSCFARVQKMRRRHSLSPAFERRFDLIVDAFREEPLMRFAPSTDGTTELAVLIDYIGRLSVDCFPVEQ